MTSLDEMFSIHKISDNMEQMGFLNTMEILSVPSSQETWILFIDKINNDKTGYMATIKNV